MRHPLRDGHLTHTAFVTMRFIDQNQSRPFLAIAGFYSPHSPWITPQKYLDLYNPATLSLPSIPKDWASNRPSISETELRSVRQGYYGMISEVDDHVGRLVGHLDDRGLRDNTIVLFISDHGEYLGDHNTYGKGPPGHDCISRVPCIVRFPDGAESNLTGSGLQEAVDVLPTLLDLCAVPIPKTVQGQSFRPALEGDASYGRESAMTESLNCRAIRTDAHRYVCHRDGREELYDLATDPGEYTSIADNTTQTSVLSDHRRLLIQRLIDASLPRRREWAY